ncbi:hypothetical protein [Sphingobium yanoikuyae]|uniref:hypothetical protein n=1 Tax=Sphingobium TaxID=165695 RepID=UPI0028B03872|nr:hypothetical protein [Sphingobium yanoikuyae]
MADEKFGEDLPDMCPPSGCDDSALEEVYRLVPEIKPAEQHFASYYALGKVKPPTLKATDCEWASCSLGSSVEALLKIPSIRKRYKYVAQLSIPAKKGRHRTDSSHIHFWRFHGFDITTSIVSVAPHGRS